jgi:hypothetical protein
MMFVTFQPNVFSRYWVNGANAKAPTPLPAMVIPVAIPLFLLKYWLTAHSDGK